MLRCAIIGATGLVGSTFLRVLEERNLPIDEFTLLASSRSKGKKIRFMDKDYTVEELDENTFKNTKFDFALFSAGGSTSIKFAPIAAKNDCIVIDNSSAFRMDPLVPLIVPQVNITDILPNSNIIANPNCSTIQAVIILDILKRLYGLKRVIYSTYQAVSGGGQKGIDDLEDTTKGLEPRKFPYKIYNNCIPQIDTFLENGYTKEEMKMIDETRKILNLPNLLITSTCVRCPVLNCHGESINVELEKDFDLLELKQELAKSDGIVVLDDISKNIYPLNTFANGKDEIFVGRLRRDFSIKNSLNFWCVADNIRKRSCY